jgi:hypothetical protein
MAADIGSDIGTPGSAKEQASDVAQGPYHVDQVGFGGGSSPVMVPTPSKPRTRQKFSPEFVG